MLGSAFGKSQLDNHCWKYFDSIKLERWNPPGGFSNGTITLDSRTTLNIFVGGAGQYTTADTTETTFDGGWNGGGMGRMKHISTVRQIPYETWIIGTSGGGGTDISTVSSDVLYSEGQTIRNDDSLSERIIVAGGGGGGAAFIEYYWTHNDIGKEVIITYGHSGSKEAVGDSHGGGLQGCGGQPGGQEAAGPNGRFGMGAPALVPDQMQFSGSGGGGWYGGGSDGRSNGGGSGYLKEIGPGIQITNGQTFDGNTEFLSPDGELESGHDDHGYVRITLISDPSHEMVVNNPKYAYLAVFLPLIIARPFL